VAAAEACWAERKAGASAEGVIEVAWRCGGGSALLMVAWRNKQ